MAHLLQKAEDAMHIHHGNKPTAGTSLDDDEKLPDGIVAASGGTYDAGPGVTEPGHTSAPIESTSHDDDGTNDTGNDGVAAAGDTATGGSEDKNAGGSHPSTGTQSSGANKKDNYDPGEDAFTREPRESAGAGEKGSGTSGEIAGEKGEEI